MDDALDCLTQRDLSKRWKVSGRTLERWRAANAGPAWYVIGGSIRYRLGDVEDFELRHRHGASRQGDADIPREETE